MKKLALLFVIITLFAISCKKETTLEPLKSGDYYQGGYIFHIDATGQHGYIMAPLETETNKTWGCYGTLVDFGGSTGSQLGWGNYSTAHMVAKCNEGTAAG